MFVFEYVNNFFSEMSQSGIKMRSKIRKIANYLKFYEIISLLAIFKAIYLTLINISENKHFYFSNLSNQRKKIKFRVFKRKVKQFFFSKATLFYFHLISVTSNLANVRVDFSHHFEFIKSLYYLGNM